MPLTSESKYMAPLTFFFAGLEILFNYSLLGCSTLTTTRISDLTCSKTAPEPFTYWNFVAMVEKGQVRI
jgi:hypothetical protein